jgi:hypothetical protein
MRRIILTLLSFSLLQLSCTKNDDLTVATFRVKIIKEICNDAILQLVDTKSSEYAENNFVFEGQTLDDVFFTTFSCEDRAKLQTLTSDLTGTVITVRLLKTQKEDPNCGRCRATVSSRPNKSNYVEVVGL